MKCTLFILLLTGLADCSKLKSSLNTPPQDVDQSTQFLSQVSGVRMSARGSSILISKDSSFELIYDPEVIHAPNRVDATDTGAHSSSANCQIRLLGKISYFSTKVLSRSLKGGTTASKVLQLNLSDAQIIGSTQAPAPATSELSPETVCQLYAAALLKKSSLKFSNLVYDVNSLQIPNPSFDVSNPGGVSPLFSAERPDSFGLAGGPLQFVRGGTQLDQTAASLKDLAGSYVSESIAPGTASDIDLSIDASLRELVITNHMCGQREIFDIGQIFSKAGYLRLQGNQVSSVAFTADATPAAGDSTPSCDAFKEAMAEITKDGLGLKYISGVCQEPNSGSCTGILLRLGPAAVQEKDSEGYHAGSVFNFKRDR